MKRVLLTISILAAVALGLVSCTQQTPAPSAPTAPAKPAKVRLLMGSTASATSLYAYSVAAANTINKYAGDWADVTTVETGAARENIYKVNTGELDFASVTTLAELYTAYRGISDYPVAYPDLRVYWGYYSGGKMWVVRADAGVNTMYDLEGKKFNPGRTGSETESTTMMALKVLGIKPDYFLGATPNAVAAMKDRKIIGYSQIGVGYDRPDSTMLDIMQTIPIKVIGMPDDGLPKIRQEMPWLAWRKVPAGVIKELPNNPAFWTTEGTAIGFGLRQLSPDLVYNMVKALGDHPEEQNAAYAPTKTFDVQKDLLDSMAQYNPPPLLHAGAVKYLKEKGYKIPDALIPPEAK